MLFAYCLIAATQGGLWNMYGPIAATVEDAFGWSDSTIALLSNWGPISYLVGGLLFSWMMDVKGRGEGGRGRGGGGGGGVEVIVVVVC